MPSALTHWDRLLARLTASVVPITRRIIAGVGLYQDQDTLAADINIRVRPHSDGSIVADSDGVGVGVITDAQHGSRAGGTTHANAIASGAAGYMTGADKAKLDGIAAGSGVPTSRTLTAGAGLTGGGDLSADRTFNVIANADGSIVVNANDVQVGVVSDAQHGSRGGGSLHSNAVASGAAGFLSGTDKARLDSFYAALTSSSATTFGAYGVTPVARPSAYTQTYSTTSRTLGAYTPDDESAAFTGIDNLQIGTVYATVADLNALRVAYENLRAFTENVAKVLNASIDDDQSQGLKQ